MEKKQSLFFFDVNDSINELDRADADLLTQAKEATRQAYAPYSRFRVAAVAKLSNNKTISATNQENASFPAGICAERVLLSSISSIYPEASIQTIAISYHTENGASDHPISPCGICRQSLQEYGKRQQLPIRLILGGLEGKILVIPDASSLLPLAFTGDELA
jgi:cytidine deaminase